MVTRSKPPDLTEVEAVIERIAPLMAEYVEPFLRFPAFGHVEGPRTGRRRLVRAELPRHDPVHYVHLLSSGRGSIPADSKAEAVWTAARVLVATRSYCLRLDPQAADVRANDSGREPNDERVLNKFELRRESRSLVDDSIEHAFLNTLEQLDTISLRAQQATVDKLGAICTERELPKSEPLRVREEFMAHVRATITELLGAARREFGTYDQVEFPRTRRAWNNSIARLGAELKHAGLTHGEVARIFPGTAIARGSAGDERPSRERARQRTRRQTRKVAALRPG